MAYRKIENAFWTDSKVRKLDNETKFLLLYILTNPHCNIIGVYRLSIMQMLSDLYSSDEVLKDFDGLVNGLLNCLGNPLVKEIVTVNFENEIIIIHNFLKHNPLENPNQIKASVNQLLQLDYIPELDNIIHHIETCCKNSIKADLSNEIEKLKNFKKVANKKFQSSLNPLGTPSPNPLGNGYPNQKNSKLN